MKLRPKSNPKENDRRSNGKVPARGRGVFSYYANRAPEPQSSGRVGQAPRPQKRRPLWRYIPSFVAAVALVISLGYVLKLDSHPKISLAAVPHGIAIRQPGEYQSAAESILKHSWFDHNKLTIDTGKVERQMKQQFPELSEVSVTLPLLGHRPFIELAAVQPVLVLSTKTGLVVVGSNGKAVAAGLKADNPALKDLPVIIDDSGLTIQTGSAVLPTSQVSFIQALVAQLKAEKLQIDSITLPAAPNQVDVRLKDTAFFIKFNTSIDARQQVGTFLAVKQKLGAENRAPSEYIDVRVEEKAFYK